MPEEVVKPSTPSPSPEKVITFPKKKFLIILGVAAILGIILLFVAYQLGKSSVTDANSKKILQLQPKRPNRTIFKKEKLAMKSKRLPEWR
jgi:hypothetical protein